MKPAEIIKKISGLLNGVSCAALAVLMLLVTLNVILRKVFNSPILGTYDLSGFLTVIAIGCGLAYCNIDNGHIEIEFFVSKARESTQKLITAAGRILSFFIMLVYTYALFNLGTRLMEANEVSVTTKTPMFIFVYLLAVCFFVFALTVLVKIFEKRSEGDQK